MHMWSVPTVLQLWTTSLPVGMLNWHAMAMHCGMLPTSETALRVASQEQTHSCAEAPVVKRYPSPQDTWHLPPYVTFEQVLVMPITAGTEFAHGRGVQAGGLPSSEPCTPQT